MTLSNTCIQLFDFDRFWHFTILYRVLILYYKTKIYSKIIYYIEILSNPILT